MVAIEERKNRKTAQRGSKNYRLGNFQASYARKFADWIVIKRNANNQVMEVTCIWCCCFKKQADPSSKFALGYKDPFKRETFKTNNPKLFKTIKTFHIHERSVFHRNCEQSYKAQKNPENTPLAKCMLKMDMEEWKISRNFSLLHISLHIGTSHSLH